MKPRERLLKALRHEEPDRIPIDLGTPVSSIHIYAYMRLKKYMGINHIKPRIIDNMQQVVAVEEPVLESFSVDTRQLFLKPFKKWQMLSDGSYMDEWGIKYKKPENSRYFDMYEFPLAHATLEDLDKYNWPDPDDPRRVRGLKEEAEYLYYQTDYAIM